MARTGSGGAKRRRKESDAPVKTILDFFKKPGTAGSELLFLSQDEIAVADAKVEGTEEDCTLDRSYNDDHTTDREDAEVVRDGLMGRKTEPSHLPAEPFILEAESDNANAGQDSIHSRASGNDILERPDINHGPDVVENFGIDHNLDEILTKDVDGRDDDAGVGLCDQSIQVLQRESTLDDRDEGDCSPALEEAEELNGEYMDEEQQNMDEEEFDAEIWNDGVESGDVPSCPICNVALPNLKEDEISVHVNRCLDAPPISRPPQANPNAGLETNTSAFSKIMAGHAEDKAWMAAAATEQSNRGKRAVMRTCPFYKIMPHMPFAVDAFRYGRVEGTEAYFLSHFHSDHYGGLTSSWSHGKIYCSKITANLCLQQLKVDPQYIVAIPFNQKVTISGVDVTLLDANHCPGSVLFVFEKLRWGRVFRILHCGDFRAHPVQVSHPALFGNKVNACYLDTTYLNPKYAFPPQDDVIDACAEACMSMAQEYADSEGTFEKSRFDQGISKVLDDTVTNADKQTKRGRGKLLVVVGTYSIGKERIVVGIARALKSRVYASSAKRRLCQCLEDKELNGLLTNDPLQASVHMTSLMEIRAETLQDYLVQYKSTFSRVVGFRPTGWNYRPPASRFTDSPTVSTIINAWSTTYSSRQLRPQRGSTSTAVCYGVPYSEHSSFRELTCFCCSLDIERIVPTVNVGSAKSREKMKSWIEKWDAEKRKQGRLQLDPDQTRW